MKWTRLVRVTCHHVTPKIMTCFFDVVFNMVTNLVCIAHTGVCVCVCVCVCVSFACSWRVHVHTHTQTHTHTHSHSHSCAHTFTYEPEFVQLSQYVHTCVHILSVPICVYMRACTYTFQRLCVDESGIN